MKHDPKHYNIIFTCKGGYKFGSDLTTIDESQTIKEEIKAFLKSKHVISITIKKGWDKE